MLLQSGSGGRPVLTLAERPLIHDAVITSVFEQTWRNPWLEDAMTRLQRGKWGNQSNVQHTSRTSHPPRLTPRTGSLPYANVVLMALSPTTLRAKRVKREKTVARRQVGVITIRDRVEGVDVRWTRSTDSANEGICTRRGQVTGDSAPVMPSPLQGFQTSARRDRGLALIHSALGILHVCWYAIELTGCIRHVGSSMPSVSRRETASIKGTVAPQVRSTECTAQRWCWRRWCDDG